MRIYRAALAHAGIGCGHRVRGEAPQPRMFNDHSLLVMFLIQSHFICYFDLLFFSSAVTGSVVTPVALPMALTVTVAIPTVSVVPVT